MRLWNKCSIGLWLGDVKCMQVTDKNVKAIDMITPVYLKERSISEVPETEELVKSYSSEKGILRRLIDKKVVEVVEKDFNLDANGNPLKSNIPVLPTTQVGSGIDNTRFSSMEASISKLAEVVASLASTVATNQQPQPPKRKSYYKPKSKPKYKSYYKSKKKKLEEKAQIPGVQTLR